jgi:hypothetical protein
LFHQTRGHFYKKYDLCPHVQLQTVVCLVLWRFWSSGFFLAEWLFRLCRSGWKMSFNDSNLSVFKLQTSTVFGLFWLLHGSMCNFIVLISSLLFYNVEHLKK